MNGTTKLSLHPIVLAAFFLVAQPLLAQSGATLSGTVATASGVAISTAKISAKNLNTGQSSDAQSDSLGRFKMPPLAPADYEITISAEGFAPKVVKIALSPGATQDLTFALTAAQGASQTPAVTLPNAPSNSQTEPTLSDLGFTPEQTQGDVRQQALLDKRTHMLKIHQRLGLITAAPLLATLITSAGAGTSDLYFTSAYFAIRAPRIKGTPTRGPIRLHKALAWVHGPGMILTPILGALAYEQKNNGEKVHGIAAAHGPVAIVTATSFGAALLAVSLKF
jgi:hypothetical protein